MLLVIKNMHTPCLACPLRLIWSFPCSVIENLESFTELPNLQILEVLGATQPRKYIEPVAEKQSSNSSA
ncbi:hypothetical protein KC19_10G016200 [Ceratodon purpureus]|uniref:Uncharacterized protein n=1 Tax=Ceratodon purpureus TaxID=3225 RepID=A0A8T0GFT0_CERPU|nr:hypothetical protein KC19_10G016200 [Ceratodon purpureus]